MNFSNLLPKIDNKTKLWIWAVVLVILIWVGYRLYNRYLSEKPGCASNVTTSANVTQLGSTILVDSNFNN